MEIINGSYDVDGLNNSILNISQETNGPSRRNIVWYIQLYLTPIIVAIGFIGNGLSFVVFIKTRLRHLSSSVYLAALCISDTLFLLQLCAWWLIYVRVFIYHKEGFCQAFIYISYASSFLSVWFVVSFTLERYIVCVYPLKKQLVCRVSRARVIVTTISVFAAILYSFAIWTSGSQPHMQGRYCAPLNKYRPLITILNHIDTLVTLIIPSFLIVFMNCRIICALSKFTSERTRMIGQQGNHTDVSREASNSSTRIGQRSTIYKSQVNITKMLVSISTIFVILNLPSHMIRIYLTLMDLFTNSSYIPPPMVTIIQEITYYMSYTNFSINFFLYSVCGQNFRLALVDLFSCFRRQRVTSTRSRAMVTSTKHENIVTENSSCKDRYVML